METDQQLKTDVTAELAWDSVIDPTKWARLSKTNGQVNSLLQ